MDNSRRSFSVSDIKISNRGAVDITGVDEILMYDDKTIILSVCGTRTVIEGDDLRVTGLSLEEGKVSCKGKVNALIYEDDIAQKKGVFSGIFKR